MAYEKHHICDTVIDNEGSVGSRLDVTVEVDSLGAVILTLGSSMTVRTTDQGAMELIHLLDDALNKLQEVAPSDEIRSTRSACDEQELANDPAKW